MHEGSLPRVAIAPIGLASVATMAFRASGNLRIVVIVKATFVIAQDKPMLRVDADPIVIADRHRDDDPHKSVIVASDLVPYRPRADVVLEGHARAPVGTPTARMGVRLMIARGQRVVLDKRLAVQGAPDPARGGEPRPFTQIPLRYEAAACGTENPVGVAEGGAPGVLDAWCRPRPVGLGPIGHRWPARRALLGDASSVDAEVPDLPSDFVWSFYSAAPGDQRIDFLQGDEWIGFEGMNSQIPRIQSCLPGVRGAARVYGPTPAMRAGMPVALVADTLAIDADRLRVSVVWRGSFGAPSDASLDAIHVSAGAADASEPFAFPPSYDPCALLPPPTRADRAEAESTVRPRRATMNADRGRAAARDMPSGTRLVELVSSGPATPWDEPKVVDGGTPSVTLDVREDLVAAPPMPFPPAKDLPPRRGPLPVATPFDRIALTAALPPPDEIDESDVETVEAPREVAPRFTVPPPFAPREEAIAPPIVEARAPEARDDAEAPKTLGQAFLQAIERAGHPAGPLDSLAR